MEVDLFYASTLFRNLEIWIASAERKDGGLSMLYPSALAHDSLRVPLSVHIRTQTDTLRTTRRRRNNLTESTFPHASRRDS